MNCFHKVLAGGLTGSALIFSPVTAAEETAPFSLGVVADYSTFDVEGAAEQSVGRMLVDLAFEYQSSQFTFFANGQLQRGKNASDFVGDIQAFSNIDESNFEKVYEAWGLWALGECGWAVKFGQIDLNTELAFVDTAGEFINSSMGFSPTIFVLPTYPDPTLGLVATKSFGRNNMVFAVNAGAGRDDFSDKFYMAEWQSHLAGLSFKVGAWYHDGAFASLVNGLVTDGTHGYYLIGEGKSDDAELGYYIQYGYADEDYSEIAQHIGFGIFQQQSAIDNLIWGIGLSSVVLSDALNTARGKETSIELFAKYELNEFFAIKPDLQYIVSPSGDKRNELVATMRFEVGF